MERMHKDLGKYVLIGIIALFLFLAYKVIASYLIVLISAFILAYLARPAYLLLNKKMGEGFSAFICVLLIILVFVVPIVIVATQVGLQAYDFVQDGGVQLISEKVSSFGLLDKFNLNLESLMNKFLSFIFSVLTDFAKQIPGLVLSLLILLFSIYYMLLSWDYVADKLKRLLPFSNRDKVADDINHSTKGIIFGYLLIALIDFLVASVGFYFLGIKLYLLFAFLIALLAFIPGAGPGVIWVPTAIYYFAIGEVFTSLGVLALGLFMGIVIETYLMTRLLGKTSKVHPLIMLLGIVGGTGLFGLFGFIIGPLILLYTLKIIDGVIDQMNS